jgi:hypothetical protein
VGGWVGGLVHHRPDLPHWKGKKTTKQKKLGEKVACLCVLLCSLKIKKIKKFPFVFVCFFFFY